MKPIAVFGLLVIIVLSLNSCHGLFDNDDDHPEANGSIKGTIQTFDSTAMPLNDLSGALVTISGNTYSHTTTTDADGKWQFDHVPAGVYQFSFDKAEYGGMKTNNVQFVGNGTFQLDSTFMGRAPKFATHISSLSVQPDRLTMIVSSPDNVVLQGRFVLSISKKPTPSPLDSSDYSVASVSGAFSIVNENNQPNGFILRSPLLGRFHSGDTCYIAAFGIGNFYAIDLYTGYIPSSYRNPETGATIYTAAGPSSNVLQFVMP